MTENISDGKNRFTTSKNWHCCTWVLKLSLPIVKTVQALKKTTLKRMQLVVLNS